MIETDELLSAVAVALTEGELEAVRSMNSNLMATSMTMWPSLNCWNHLRPTLNPQS